MHPTLVRALRLALPLLALTLNGCVPMPHRYQHMPRVSGVVSVRSVPVADVRVGLAYYGGDPCANPEITATTDAGGRFAMPGERRVRLYIIAVPAHSVESWQFCLQRQSHSAVIWATPERYRVGPRYGPDAIELECDLARTVDICSVVHHGTYGKWG